MASEKQPLLPIIDTVAQYGGQDGLTAHSPRKRKSDHVLVIHGGAGTMSRANSTPEREARYKAALAKALQAGHDVLSSGGEAMDAAVAAVSTLEDCPLFNSGKGAVFNVEGKNELEASIMLSKPPSTHPSIPPSRRGLALTLLTRTRNPSHLARSLYLSPDRVPHVLLAGPPTEALSDEPAVEPDYFFTESRWREHRRGLGLPEEPLPYPPDGDGVIPLDMLPKGTVGAVALDIRGCLATVTSTGGRTNKLVGRIGDTPQMGAGFWAEEWSIKSLWARLRGRRVQGVAVSGTGDGDYFLRQATAVSVARRMRYAGQSLSQATKGVIEDLRVVGGDGGIIALDMYGNVAMPLNSAGMYRGVIHPDGVPKTAIFDDDVLS